MKNTNHLPKRIFEVFYQRDKEFPRKDAYVTKINGEWVKTSTSEFLEKVNQLSKGLIGYGIKPGDRIATIFSSNSTDWSILDAAIMQIGAVSVPVYPNISSKDYHYIFDFAEVKLCFISDEIILEKVKLLITEVSSLQKIYSTKESIGIDSWKSLFDSTDTFKEELSNRMNNVKETDLVSIIFTSGTSGTPKGVMLSHKNFLSNVEGCIPRLPEGFDRVFSFLPACHVFERMLLYLYASVGYSIYYAESIESLSDNLKEVSPDFMSVVPRLLEKVYSKILAKGEDLKGIKRKLFFWALQLGVKYKPFEPMSFGYKVQLWIARKLIFSKWKEALGGRLFAMVSGSAPLQPKLIRVFSAAGITVYEGYGTTETSPVIATNSVGNNFFRIGTVGKPIPGVEVKIADDDEILVKGDLVMIGYLGNKEKTNQVIDQNGYYHTGDKGTLEDGFLKITGRKKEIFKTSGGKYIVPNQIENLMKESPFIEQMIVIGEGKKMPCALIQLDFDYVKNLKGFENFSNKEISESEEIKSLVEKDVERYNKELGKWEKIKKFELVPEVWSVENGILTPTLKVKRDVIKDFYSHLFKKIYEE